MEMRNFIPHGTQVFVVRGAAVPPDLLCKARNVKPILVIPGPVAPQNYDPYWRLILDLFAGASPLGGVRCLICGPVDAILFCILELQCDVPHFLPSLSVSPRVS